MKTYEEKWLEACKLLDEIELEKFCKNASVLGEDDNG